MTRIPIRVVEAKQPKEPLHLRCSRALALRLGAMQRGYFFGTCVGDPVMMILPNDVPEETNGKPSGLIWPLLNGAYLGTSDKL